MPCVVCAHLSRQQRGWRQRMGTEAHHESVALGYSGGQKRWFDFGALPLCTDHHTERHVRFGGLRFWAHHFGPGGESVPLLLAGNLMRDWAQAECLQVGEVPDQWEAYTAERPLPELELRLLAQLVLAWGEALTGAVDPFGEPY
jgi:hypothetical protein